MEKLEQELFSLKNCWVCMTKVTLYWWLVCLWT